MNQRHHDQELEPQVTYDSFPKEESPFPVERQESQQPATSHMNGWDFLALVTSRFFDWLETVAWKRVGAWLIIPLMIIATILAEIISHWH
jgi:hypothetical protein